MHTHLNSETMQSFFRNKDILIFSENVMLLENSMMSIEQVLFEKQYFAKTKNIHALDFTNGKKNINPG